MPDTIDAPAAASDGSEDERLRLGRAFGRITKAAFQMGDRPAAALVHAVEVLADRAETETARPRTD